MIAGVNLRAIWYCGALALAMRAGAEGGAMACGMVMGLAWLFAVLIPD